MFSKSRGALVGLVVPAFLFLGAIRAGDNLPVPSPGEIAKAEELIKDLFKKEYARTKASDRAMLAAKLLQQAGESKDDAVSKYVLLREARDVAAKAGDATTAMKAAEEIAAAFKLGPGEARAPAAAPLVAAATTATALRNIAETLVDASDEALPVDDWQSALTLLKAADAAARKAQATALATSIRAKIKRVETLQIESQKIKPHLAALEKKADDPDANLAVGKFLCFVKHDWSAGVGHLAKSGDAKLQNAAQKDLDAAEGQEKEQVAAADAWYDLASGTEAGSKSAVQFRAYYWYNKALPGIEGLSKLRADKRVTELHAIVTASADKSAVWRELRKAVTNNQLKRWRIVGGAFGQNTYEEILPEGAILIGFRCTTIQKGRYPGMVQGIYLTSRGEVMGKVFGAPDKTSSPVQTVKAKAGYAVGALYTRGGGGIDAIKPIFMRISDKGLNTKDQYAGPHMGGLGGGEDTLGGDGTFIVGLHGKTDDNGRLSAVSPVSMELSSDVPKKPKGKNKRPV